jgi:GT2 family glycosyltransferase
MTRTDQKYSIILPSYTITKEHKEVLKRALASLQDAMSLNTELILIDDGSIFDISDLYEQGPHKVIIHRRNSGIATSWNDGLKLARGEYIAIINDDITVEIGWLDKLRQALEFEDEYMVSAPGVSGGENGIGIEEDYQWFPGYCFMLKQDTVDKIGLFDEQFSPFNYEDTDYWTRVLKTGGKLVRNYSTTITHKEGDVLHSLNYDKVDQINKQKFIEKHGFNPTPVFYYGEPAPWEK